jgi:hypothetical protein
MATQRAVDGWGENLAAMSEGHGAVMPSGLSLKELLTDGMENSLLVCCLSQSHEKTIIYDSYYHIAT